MREYETMVILKPDLTDKAVGDLGNKLGGIIKKGNGMVLDILELGKKPLAYDVKKQPKGNYIQISFRGEGNIVGELEKSLRITDEVIRFMTTSKEKALEQREQKKGEKK